MAEVIGFYVLFAVVTSIHGLMELLAPIFQKRVAEGLQADRQFLIYLVFFCTSLLIAPVIFLACMVPSVGETFRENLEKGIFTEE